MDKVKEYKQLGSYGLVVNDNKILLIKKNGGPYDGKLDLPGGTIDFNERPSDALVREFKRRYPKTVAFRLKKHAMVVQKHLNPEEKVLFVFCGSFII